MAPTTVPVDVMDFVVNQRNGVKGLVDIISPKTLPSRYIQPPEERLVPGKILAGGESMITIVDVSDWTDPRVANEICSAAATLGLFQMVNHGIPAEELQDLRMAAHGFFGMGAEERKRYWRGNSVAAETAWLTTSFNPYKEEVLEWRDFMKFEYLPQQPNIECMWPSVCREQVIQHFKKTKPIIKKIVNILINNLNSQIDKSKLEQTLMGTLRMNFNYYPACPNPEIAAGTGRHSDINTLTLLLQDDNVGGLYARISDHHDHWIHVPPIHGAIVVNIGDVLQILSNDHYRSVEHMVIVDKFCNRVSVPVFAGPVHDSVIQPLPEVMANAEAPRYKKTVYSEYLKYFFGRPHDGKKTIESIRI